MSSNTVSKGDLTTPVKDNAPDHEHLETMPDINTEKGQLSQEELVETTEWRARERRLVRKLDMTLLPVVWVLYLFNYLDRNNISYVPYMSQRCSTMC
jgi:hypothetical protein